MPHLLLIFAAVLVANLCAVAEEEKPEPILSPNGRFVFRYFTEEEEKDTGYGFLVEEKRTGRVVLRTPAEAGKYRHSESVVFSPDASHLALNFQAGSRYDATFIYRWNGKQFVKIAMPATALSRYLLASEAAQLKELGIEDTQLLRIRNTWETQRWINANTAVVLGSAPRTFEGEGEERKELTVEFLFTVRFDKAGKMKLLKREKPPENEAADSLGGISR